MKHVFVINPVAGFENCFNTLSNNLQSLKDKYDITVYVTSSVKDATQFSKEFALSHKDESVRFYSCGGDGTLSEVANGIAGLENASITCYPCGSGNDFVKSVGGKEKYLNLEKLFNSQNRSIDLIKVNDVYSINVCNVGLEAHVCKVANSLKGKTKNPYTMGIIDALFKGMKHSVFVEADGELLNPDGKLLLSTFANGGYAGGKYNCAPKFKIDDGLIEVCLVKPVSVFTLLKLIKKYEKGLHLDDRRFDKIVTYRQAKKIRLYSEKPFDLCVDGEMFIGKEFILEISTNAINFAIPE